MVRRNWPLSAPKKPPIGPENSPTRLEKALFFRKDFSPVFSENLGLKPPFVSPRLGFPRGDLSDSVISGELGL